MGRKQAEPSAADVHHTGESGHSQFVRILCGELSEPLRYSSRRGHSHKCHHPLRAIPRTETPLDNARTNVYAKPTLARHRRPDARTQTTALCRSPARPQHSHQLRRRACRLQLDRPQPSGPRLPTALRCTCVQHLPCQPTHQHTHCRRAALPLRPPSGNRRRQSARSLRRR